MANYDYESLVNDKIQFLQGTQQNLNKYLDTGDTATRGKAIEGAFYLTTDTHRLYIGRKVVSATGNAAVGDVFPEEISAGITIVKNTTELGSAAVNANVGDFYYISDLNALTILVEEPDDINPSAMTKKWRQLNSPTGIGKFDASVASTSPLNTIVYSGSSTYAKVITSIKPDGATASTQAAFWLQAGDNIKLEPGGSGVAGNPEYGIRISSKNSQSTLKVSDTAISATASQGTTGVPIILHDTDNPESQVYFKGSNLTTVESDIVDGRNVMTIAGPKLNGILAQTLGTAGVVGETSGFRLAINAGNGNTDSTTAVTLSNNRSVINPIIKYGVTASHSAAFYGGEAVLNVYSTTETNEIIASEIAKELQTADALHYKGIITLGANETFSDFIDDNDFSIGDVYKAGQDFDYANGVIVHTGDLIIAKGTEGSDGYITNQTLDFDIIPSGDEPLLVGKTYTTNSSPGFGLEDKNISDTYPNNPNKRLLNVTFDNTYKNSWLIEAVGGTYSTTSSYAAKEWYVQFKHVIPTTGTSVTLTAASAILATTATESWDNDSIQKGKATFKAITGITKDDYGHIIDIAGEDISIYHNYVNKVNVGLMNDTCANYARITLGLNDVFGLANNKLTDANKGKIYFFSDSLKFTSTTGIHIDLVWGEFT